MTNVTSISQNVESMVFTFTGCSQLVLVLNIPTSVNNMVYTFQSCRNLGNVIIESSEVMNSIHCFRSTTATKNVYIPFNSTTYNSFINAGYDENGTQHGVYLKDINSL